MNLFQKYTIILMVCISSATMAQMPNDAIYMPKKTYCIAVIGTQTQWSEYWENKLLRENLNIGTNTTNAIGIMAAIGVTDKLNILANLPYISTSNSAGNLMGQKGIQDLSGWLKYKLLNKGGLTLNTVLGGSIPIGNYVPDFLPMSIGLQAKSAIGRLIGNYHHKSGLYIQAHGSYTFRSTIKIDKNAYQADNKVYNTNIVNVPNTIDARASLGYYKKGKQFEAFVEQFSCVNGDYIRRNDMPFPTNNMQSVMYGFYGKFQPKNLGINARIGYCYKGQNVGKGTQISVGILYQIKAKNNTAK
jgi:hypothetical protein